MKSSVDDALSLTRSRREATPCFEFCRESERLFSTGGGGV